MPNSLIGDWRPAWTSLAVAMLLVAAGFLRLPDLGVLGFYGDEETTASRLGPLQKGADSGCPAACRITEPYR